MWLRLVILLALGGVFLVAAAPLAEEKPKPVITIASDEWCPINCVPNSKEEGIAIELARAIYEPLGYKVDYILMPWSRALDEVQTGKLTAVVGAIKEDAPSFTFPHFPVTSTSDNLYMRNDRTGLYTSAESLKELRVGIIEDYAYGDVMMRHIKRYRNASDLIQVAKGEDALNENMRKLLAGRIDVLVESELVMNYTLRRINNTNSIIWVGKLPYPNDVYIAFSPMNKDSQQLAKIFDEGMAKLTKEKRIAPIYARYGLQAPF